ncbi:MAG: DUF1549 domain-containing protein [Planctomycetaceae bacterium]|nr:DUF1549 domain-containing protein [Planctomycetaceae bacterium]
MRTTQLSRLASLCFAALAIVASVDSLSRAADQSAVAAPTSPFKRLIVVPEKATLAGARSTQGLRIIAEYADGILRDVTEQAEYRSTNPVVAEVSETGLVTPQTNGSVQITAKYHDTEVTANITIGKIDDHAYSFRNDVLPVLEKLTCNQMGCHGSPKGKKRLQLSLFSADPQKDYLQLADKQKKLVDPAEPARSWMLLKAICEEDHGGGNLTDEGTPEYNLLVDWIKNGAPEGPANDREIVRVDVYPAERRMVPGEKQRLLVEAYYNDGTMRDVTDLASFKSDEEAVAKALPSGVVEGTGFGEAIVMVSYSGKLSTSRVISSQVAKVPFPQIATTNKIDEHVLAKLKSLNILPSEVAGDSEFLRRVYLDVIGMLPTADEARAFLADNRPDKRARVIDELLARPEYADYYALKWGDVLQINRNEPAQLQEKGMWAFYRWVWEAIDQNKPMDKFVHEILTARGSGYRNGPANFFRVGEGPQGMAEHASTAFLGVRLDCAHCHNHPFEQFTLIDNLGMAAFFTKVKIKRSSEQDEEIVYLADNGSIKNPDTNQVAMLKFLGVEELSANEKLAADKTEAERVAADVLAKAKVAASKSASDKAAADKTAGAKRVADKNTALTKAKEQLAIAKKAAEQATTELAAAEKDAAERTESSKADAAKIVTAKQSAKQAKAKLLADAQAAVDRATADKTAVEKAADEQNAANNAAVSKANAEKSAADKDLNAKTAAARAAAAALTSAENDGDPRAKLAAWIASPENPWFAKHMANRVWTWLLGRGIIDEPDDFRSTNPASNPPLIDHLAKEFIRTGYDMKAMFRLVLNTRTYQLTARPNNWNKHDHIYYSHANLKRLSAEQLATSISEVTGIAEKYPGLPLGTRATQLPDVSMRSEFLDLFGRPKRATPVESERTCDTHIGQSLQMISSDYIASKLRDNAGRVAKLAASQQSFAEKIDELYLMTLARFPTDSERQVILAQPIDDKQVREKLEDLAWVLMNTKEFLFNH